jgi:hypothetical protein
MSAMVGRNLILALFLSFILTIAVAIVYAFFPLISVMLSGLFDSHGTGGIAVVAGGMSRASFLKLLLIETIFFLLIFALLQWRRANYR